MKQDELAARGNLFRAATSSFDFFNPAQALSSLLKLATELTGSERAALYELDEVAGSFAPRFSHATALSELGRIQATPDHPTLRSVLTNRKAAVTGDGRGSLGLPLAPGAVACAPCITGGQTLGLLFVAAASADRFDLEALSTLEVLATRAAEIFTFARQTASQSYLFHKLSLLYQASHAITSTRERQETIRQTAAHLLRATSADICEVLVFEDGSSQTMRFRQQLGRAGDNRSLITDSMPDYPIHKQVTSDLTGLSARCRPRARPRIRRCSRPRASPPRPSSPLLPATGHSAW
jgi:GAF domain-containing protein